MAKHLEPSDDRHVPDTYQGKLEPNYYCRAWNEKRDKYCKARAGKGTDHKGVGRCDHHGGNAPIKSGRYSMIQRPELQDAIAAFLEQPDPLDLLEEVAMLKALLRADVNRHEELTDALLAWNEAELDEWYANGREGGRPRLADIPQLSAVRDLITDLSLVVSRIQKARSDQAISRKHFLRVITEMGRAVELAVDDPKVLERIKTAWNGIQLA